MHIEYLLLNIIIIAVPLSLSFDKRVHFYKYWSKLIPAIFMVMIIFLIWDALATGRHWFFNKDYTLPARLLNLPIGEWLFFITVPYACIFVWEVLAAYFTNHAIKFSTRIQLIISILFMLTGLILLFTGKEYTVIVLIAAGLVFILDILLKTNIFRQSRIYSFSSLLLIMMLIFNGYLTFRPIVLYDPQYQLDFRILTIPVEDFFYGFALIFFVLIIYEKFKGIKNG